MVDRNSIIEKIKALLAKTTANGATEHEMMAALDKASAMKDAYDISDADVQLAKDEAAMLHADAPDLKDPHNIKWRLSRAVGVFCNVEVYRSRGETGLKCIGMPSDVQFAIFLLDHLADFVFAEIYIHLFGSLAPKSERRLIIRSFTEACCERVSCRLRDLAEQSRAVRTTNGRELIVVQDAAIKAFMKDNGIRLRTCGGYRPSSVNDEARAAGHAAGDRATFGRPVSGPAGALKLT